MQKELIHLLFSFTFFCLFTTNTYAANTNLSSGLSGYKNINCVSSEEVFVLDIPCGKCYNKAKGSDAQWNTTEL